MYLVTVWVVYPAVRFIIKSAVQLLLRLVGWNLNRGVGTGQPADVAGVASADVTAVQAARLRRRSKWVCRLADTLGDRRSGVGKLLGGRWKPDLPSQERAAAVNVIAALVDDGVKFLGGGIVTTQEDEPANVVYLHVELKDGTCHTIFPALVGELSCFAGFRPRNSATLMALRHRALEWCKRSSIRWIDFQQGFFSSVAFGLAASSSERVAVELIGRSYPLALAPLV